MQNKKRTIVAIIALCFALPFSVMLILTLFNPLMLGSATIAITVGLGVITLVLWMWVRYLSPKA